MATYGAIGGPLPFAGGQKDYASAYNSALQFNKANYSQILEGYQNTSKSAQDEQAKILAGHQALSGQVLGMIQGIDASQRQDIGDKYARMQGQEMQSLISKGLGNSTVQSAVTRGLLYDKEKSDIMLTNQTQGLNAKYLSELGLAGLGYQDRANQQNMMMNQNQLQWMNSINAAYPNPMSWEKMAMMKGNAAGGSGFQVPGGVPGSSGAVKSPLGPGGGSNSPGYYGGGYGGGGYSGARPAANYGNSPSELYPAADAWWDFASGGGGGTRWDQNAGGVYGESPLFNEDVNEMGVPSMGGNAGGGWDAMQAGIWGDGAPSSGSDYSYDY